MPHKELVEAEDAVKSAMLANMCRLVQVERDILAGSASMPDVRKALQAIADEARAWLSYADVLERRAGFP